jgi:predicted  nucleic acid-binding Zn-ribbon protein
MARVQSYTKDASINEKDKLLGSSFISTSSGADVFETGNFTIGDLARFFANYNESEGTVYNLATFDQSISTNATNIGNNTTYSTNLAGNFGTFDANGNLVTLSEAFANQVFTTTTNADFASASYTTNLASNFGTFDVNGNLTALSEAFANSVMSTTTSQDAASATALTNLTAIVNNNTASITTNATDITTVTASATSNATDITTNEGNITTVTTAAAANTTDIATLTSNLATANASINQNSTSITTLDSSVTSNTTNISGNGSSIISNSNNITANATAITTLTNNLSTSNTSIQQNASDVTSLTSNVTTNTTNISNNDTAITNANTNIATNASDITTLTNNLATTDTNVTQNATDVTTLDTSVTTNTTDITTANTNITTANTNIATNASAITTLTNNLATANTAITQNATNHTSLSSDVTTNETAITANGTAITTANTNIATNATNITSLTNDLTTAEADITQNATDVTSLTTTVGTNTTGLGTANTNIATNATSISTLDTAIATANTNIAANATDIVTLDTTSSNNGTNITANATAITNLSTTVGTNTTSISTNATSINGIEGRYGVTIDSNGALTGFQLIGSSTTSVFKVNADDFKIYTSGGDLNPFSVSGGVVQINGNLNVSGTASITGSSNTGQFIACDFKNTGSSGLSSIRVLNSSNYYGLFRLNTTVAGDIGYYGIDLVIGPATGGGEKKLVNFNGGGLSMGLYGTKIFFNDGFAGNATSSAAGAIGVRGSSDGQATQAMFVTVPTNQATSTPAFAIETNGSASIFKVFKNSHVETGSIQTSGNISGATINSSGTIIATGAITSNSSVTGTNFIDKNDANYYLNPNSTSNLNAITLAGNMIGVNGYFNNSLGLGFNSGSIGGKLNIRLGAANQIGIKNNLNGVSNPTGLLSYTTASMNSGGYHLVFQAAPTSGTDTNMLLCNINGNLRNRNNSYGQYSDQNIKENITDATPKLEDVKKLKVKNFNFIGDDLKQIGLIAQETELVFPGLVEDDLNPQGDQIKSLKYSVLVPILVKAIQELEARVTTLEG